MSDALTPWEPSLLAPACLLAASAFYLRRKTHEPWAAQLAFWSGLLLFYVAAFTHLDYLAEHQFFIHRLQHALLHHLAPSLMVLSRPGRALWSGLPRAGQMALRAVFNRPPVIRVVAILNHPVVAVFLFCGLIAFWLIPAVHFLAMIDVRLYKLMNWSMALNGLMFWSLVLNNFALRPASLSPGMRIAVMLAVAPPQVLIGLMLVFMPSDIYPVYAVCGRLALDALADQQIGGAILWLSGMMMSLGGILIVVARDGFRPGPA
jgi:putative membrane protein